MYTRLCVWVHVRYVCVHVYISITRPEVEVEHLPSLPSLLYDTTVSLLSEIHEFWLVSEPQGSFCFFLPCLRTTSVNHHTQLCLVCLGFSGGAREQIRFVCWQREHMTHQALSPALINVLRIDENVNSTSSL